MMNLKNTSKTLLVALTLAAALVGCGKSDSVTTPAINPAQNSNNNLTPGTPGYPGGPGVGGGGQNPYGTSYPYNYNGSNLPILNPDVPSGPNAMASTAYARAGQTVSINTNRYSAGCNSYGYGYGYNNGSCGVAYFGNRYDSYVSGLKWGSVDQHTVLNLGNIFRIGTWTANCDQVSASGTKGGQTVMFHNQPAGLFASDGAHAVLVGNSASFVTQTDGYILVGVNTDNAGQLCATNFYVNISVR